MIQLKKNNISELPPHFVIPKLRDDKMGSFSTESEIQRLFSGISVCYNFVTIQSLEFSNLIYRT